MTRLSIVLPCCNEEEVLPITITRLKLAMGVTGMYIGRIYMEVKRRPLYHVDKSTYTRPAGLNTRSIRSTHTQGGKDFQVLPHIFFETL